ncbi:hypothetical protein BDQ17DRAFT_1323952 [Cyathus striatus]|nr:hypothetical protein BDQ17DRAFT_1323952 [Cyathus striatus]
MPMVKRPLKDRIRIVAMVHSPDNTSPHYVLKHYQKQKFYLPFPEDTRLVLQAARNSMYSEAYIDNIEKMKRELIQPRKAMDYIRKCCEIDEMDSGFAKDRKTELMDQMENMRVQILALGEKIPEMEEQAPSTMPVKSFSVQ